MMKIRTIIFLMVLCMVSGFSQEIKTGLPFLKQGNSARSSAMGDAFTAVTNDQSTYYFNPATIRFSQRQLSLSHRQGFAETSTDYIGATLPGDDITFALSAYTTSVSDIEIRLRPGDAEGTFGARNGAISAGAAFSLSNGLSVGLTGKLLYEKIYIDEASGYGIDAGLLYKATTDLTVGMSILNLGSMSVLRSERSVLPTTLRLGAAYNSIFSEDVSLTFAGDAVKTFNDNVFHIHIGGETVYQNMFMLRAGYQTGYETKSFTLGAGVLYGIIRFDYAFIPMTGLFSPNHTFSFTFNL